MNKKFNKKPNNNNAKSKENARMNELKGLFGPQPNQNKRLTKTQRRRMQRARAKTKKNQNQ